MTYHYDTATGQLNRVEGPGLPAWGVEYERMKNGTTPVSDAVAHVRYLAAQNGDPLVRTQRQYETSRDLIDFIDNVVDPEDTNVRISKYDYTNDDLGRRIDMINPQVA